MSKWIIQCEKLCNGQGFLQGCPNFQQSLHVLNEMLVCYNGHTQVQNEV